MCLQQGVTKHTCADFANEQLQACSIHSEVRIRITGEVRILLKVTALDGVSLRTPCTIGIFFVTSTGRVRLPDLDRRIS